VCVCVCVCVWGVCACARAALNRRLLPSPPFNLVTALHIPEPLNCPCACTHCSTTCATHRHPQPNQPKQIGGSGVLVQPMTYIFDEEPLRWQRLLEALGESS
jgi:hypothetical protein